MRRVLITGGKCMLGRSLVERIGDEAEVLAVDIDEINVTNEKATRRCVEEFRPDLVIHCAALTDVDKCEDDPDVVYLVNAQAPQLLASLCAESGAAMVQVSTDFVFDGKGSEPYTEDSPTSPISVYGASKLDGEERVRAKLAEHFIVRTAWTFAPWGHNFVRSIIRAAKERGALTVVDDQVGCPTYAPDLADGIWRLAATTAYGTYHMTNAGIVSRLQFARDIVAAAGLSNVPVDPIKSADLNQPAARPAYAPLASVNLPKAGIAPLRPYAEALAECINRLPAD